MKNFLAIGLIILYGCSNSKITNHNTIHNDSTQIKIHDDSLRKVYNDDVKKNHQDSIQHKLHDDGILMMNSKYVIKNADYYTSDIIFDTLSASDKNSFLSRHKNEIKHYTFRYYGKYQGMKNMNDLMKVYLECDIDSIKNFQLLPFYVYVLKQLNNNKSIDGAYGEITDFYYKLLMKYPGYYYQYLDYIYSEKKENVEDILYSTIGEFYLNTDKKYAKEILNEFKEKIKSKNIDSINRFIIRNWDFNK